MSEAYIMDTNNNELKRLEAKFDISAAKEQLEKLGFKNGMCFLDVGCGGGAMTRIVTELAKDSAVFGVDKNNNYVLYASKLAQEKSITNITYKQGNVYDLPFEDNTFDFVWCRFLMEYLKKPVSAIVEMRRVSKTKGIVCCGDIDGNCLFHYPITKNLEKKLNKVMAILKSFGFDPFVGRKLYHYFRQAGFKDIKVQLCPYHNIAGYPSEKDVKNWEAKINNVADFLSRSGEVDLKFITSLKGDFLKHIWDEKTFTYSTLIFAKGLK